MGDKRATTTPTGLTNSERLWVSRAVEAGNRAAASLKANYEGPEWPAIRAGLVAEVLVSYHSASNETLRQTLHLVITCFDYCARLSLKGLQATPEKVGADYALQYR